MSDDAWLNNWNGAGQGITSPALNPTGGAYCDYSSVPSAKVNTFQVTFDYEAWYTGAIDSASLATNVKNVDSKLLGYLASSVDLCDDIACTANSNNCVDIYNKALANTGIVGIAKNSTDIIQTKCKLICFVYLKT